MTVQQALIENLLNGTQEDWQGYESSKCQDLNKLMQEAISGKPDWCGQQRPQSSRCTQAKSPKRCGACHLTNWCGVEVVALLLSWACGLPWPESSGVGGNDVRHSLLLRADSVKVEHRENGRWEKTGQRTISHKAVAQPKSG